MHSESLQIELCEPVATLRLNRPEVRNALDETLIADLAHAISALQHTAKIRVVILAAQGPVFCAGADLDWMRRMAEFSTEQNLEDARKLADMLHIIDTCTKPVIAKIQGDAYGGGIGLLAVSDIAVAAKHAQFCLSEVKLGLVPATISPYVVRSIGARQARRYALSAEKFTALEAQRVGLVHEVCADDQLDQSIENIVHALLQASPQAITATKQLLAQVTDHPIDDMLREMTAVQIAQARSGDEGREGIQAFLAKRKPRWLS
jgi:methylglutaconyl-CoA hydratase